MKITKSILWAKTVKRHAGDKPIFRVVRGITPVPGGNPGTKFQLKWQFNFRSRTEKREHHHLILHIQISLGTRYLPKLTILTFLTKFALKRYVQSKRKKVNSTNEFFTFYIQVISEWKQKKWTLPLNSAFSNYGSLINFSLNC